MDPAHILASGTLLDPEALTIGFAHRFATYKRATLLFRDLERLKRLLQDRWRPVQIIFAGKAHPADEPGKYRSEEHTSELQSRGHLVCRLLLEKKNKNKHDILE